MNGRSRPWEDGPEEFRRSGVSASYRSNDRVIVVRLIARLLLFDPSPYGSTALDDLTVRLSAAAAVVDSVPGLTDGERLGIRRSLPWSEAVARVFARDGSSR